MTKRVLLPLLLVLALILSACGQVAAPAPDAAKPAAEATKAPVAEAPAPADGAKESPMLAERVAAGELPPLEERIPKEPFVVGQG